MKTRKTIALLLAAVTCFSALSGCAPAKKEQIVMATNAQFPPFEYVTNKGLVDKYSGVDVAISLEIAKALGKELVINDMEFTSVLAAVPSGSADFAAAGMTVKPDRLESMDFSIPYYTAMQYIIVKADNTTINSSKDIIDKKVGVVQGYTGETACIDMGVEGLNPYKSGMEAVEDLKQGRLDAVVIDSHTANAMVALNSELKNVLDPDAFESEQYAIAVKKGNTELLNTINTVLKNLIDTGKIDEFVLTYSKDTIDQQ